MSVPIVYIVGAGLTKSLEAGSNRVPLMADFLATMACHVDDSVIADALANYELEGWFEWEATPAGRDLAKRVKDGDTSALAAFARELQRRPAENIEDLLERFTGGPRAPKFINDINRLFWKIGFGVRLELLQRFLRHQASLDASHLAVSFNYDLVFERALQDLQLWHPGNGYGFPMACVRREEIDRSFEIARGRSPSQPIHEVYVGMERWPDGVLSRWRVVKPHGSLNWVDIWVRYGDFDVGAVVDAQDRVAYVEDPALPSAMLAGPMSGVPRQIQIAPPGAKELLGIDRRPGGKRPLSSRPRVDVMAELQSAALREAEEVFVLGWSMPRTDSHQEGLIKACSAQRGRKLRRLVVVNRGAPVDYFRRMQSAFNPDEIDVHNDGFARFVETLPTPPSS